MKKRLFISFLSMFVCCALCLLVGCVGNNNIKFGNKTDTTKTLTLINATGQDITAVNIQLVGDTNSKELAASDNKSWSNESTAEIYLEAANGSTASTQSGELQLKAAYNITFMLKDGTSVTVHNLTQAGAEDYKNAKLCINAADKLAYIEYSDPTGATVSTLAAEQKIVADQQAAAEAQNAKQYKSQNNSSNQSTDDCTGGNIKLR